MRIELASIRTDGGTQPREAINTEIVAEYVEAMESGATFPPVVVYFDGEAHWLADGFHRVAAARQAGISEIDAEVHQGSQRDAVLHSVGANSTHGMRRTNADKRRAAMVLLRDDEWTQWSDREIARRCGVSQPFVSGLRPAPSDNGYQSQEKVEKLYKRQDGTPGKMNTGNIGRKPRPQPDPDVLDEWVEPEDIRVEDPAEAPFAPSEYETTVESAIRDINGYIDVVVKELPDVGHQHAVITEVLKHARALAIDYNRRTA